MEKYTKIYLVVSLIGILILIFISNNIEPKQIDITNITDSYLNKKVKIVGEMVNITDYDGFQVITIRDITGKIKVTANSKTNLNQTEKEIMVIGEVTKYEGELEIIADKIIELQN